MMSPSAVHPRLWIPVWSDPELAAEAEELARSIASDELFAKLLALAGDVAALAQILTLARDAAEPRIDLQRVREVEQKLMQRLPGPPGQTFADLVAAAKMTKVKSPARSMILEIDRYQRRAHSRWSKADRALATVRRRQQRRVFRLTERLQRRVDARSKKSNTA
jgi:NTP pyrophosphatase (non-canonical NTP hydrolase)